MLGNSWAFVLALLAIISCLIATLTLGWTIGPWKDFGESWQELWGRLRRRFQGRGLSGQEGPPTLTRSHRARREDRRTASGRDGQPDDRRSTSVNAAEEDEGSVARRLAPGWHYETPTPPSKYTVSCGDCGGGGATAAAPLPEVPGWLQQLARGPSDLTAAAQLLEEGQAGECTICFEPLWRAGASVMRVAGGYRICPHYLCEGCCTEVLQQATPSCPVCRVSAEGAYCDRIPDPRLDPMGWFNAVDTRGIGLLSRQEVSLGLEATLPLSRGRLQAALDAPCPATPPCSDTSSQGSGSSNSCLWKSWCAKDTDTVGPHAFIQRGGLLQWVYEHLGELGRTEGEGERFDESAEVLAVELKTCPEAWFNRFSVNGTAGLSEGEILRAMMRTFAVSSLEKSTLLRLRGRITASWRSWDRESVGQVTLKEFLTPGGLHEDLVKLLDVAASPRESIKAVLLDKSLRKEPFRKAPLKDFKEDKLSQEEEKPQGKVSLAKGLPKKKGVIAKGKEEDPGGQKKSKKGSTRPSAQAFAAEARVPSSRVPNQPRAKRAAGPNTAGSVLNGSVRAARTQPTSQPATE